VQSVTFVGKVGHEVASKRSGSRAKSGGEAKRGKRTAKKGSLKDLPAKDGQKIRGGFTPAAPAPLPMPYPISSKIP